MNSTVYAFLGGALLLAALLAPSSQPTARAPHLDHVAIVVSDLNRSATFYEKVLQLQPVSSPYPHILWFSAGDHLQLHLIKGEPGPPRAISNHVALRVASLEATMQHLRAGQVKFRNFQDERPVPVARPDGVNQIYLQDPDGNWFEINDAKY